MFLCEEEGVCEGEGCVVVLAPSPHQAGVSVSAVQSNDASAILSHITTAATSGYAGIVINPGGFVGRRDEDLGFQAAIAACGIPVFETHYGNPWKRNPNSCTAPAVTAIVCGLGVAR